MWSANPCPCFCLGSPDTTTNKKNKTNETNEKQSGKSAFLQGKELKREVYLRPPVESHNPSNIMWKLKHRFYGLKDGARQFFISVKEELLKLGFKQCTLDPAIFYVRKDEKLRGIICCHVDDFLHSGDMYFETFI